MSRLRELRQARGWTLKYLSGQAGVSLATVHNIEAGRTYPSRQTQKALSDAFGLKVWAIFPAAQDEPEVRPKISDPKEACTWCGLRVPKSSMIIISNAPTYAKRRWHSERCMEQDIGTDPCARGECGHMGEVEKRKHNPE